MAEQLKDKVVIVTGSSSGIGEAIAIMFASRGAKVTLCGRDQERLKTVFDKVVKASGGHKDKFLIVQGDLNDPKVQQEIIDQTVEKFGRLDILVANAGVAGVNQTILTATEECYNTIMDTNLKSMFFLIQKAVPHLEKSKGNIVNISSNVTSLVIPLVTVYAMSKSALDHLTRCLAVDLGPRGIRVNSVNPGYIPTKLGRDLGENASNIVSLMTKLDFEKQPLKTRHLTSDDIAEAVLFVASDAAGFITGEQIRVDGGRSYSGPVDLSSLKL